MAYTLKPNYHFASTEVTGISKVPLNRFVIVENIGIDNETKWFKKIASEYTETGIDIDTGDPISNTIVIDGSTTIQEAIDNGILYSPLDDKLDISDSYTSTEIDSMLSTKANVVDVYSKTESDGKYRLLTDSYSSTEVDSLVDKVIRTEDTIFQQSYQMITDYTVAAGNNAVSYGPIVMNDNITVTISDGSTWTIF